MIRAIYRVDTLSQYLQKPVSIAPLVSFRVLFGLLMSIAAWRILALGWVEKFYVRPSFFFKFYGFEWVQSLGAGYMQALYVLMAIAALCIALGAFYRLSSLVFFVLFTYTELIDITHYLNHYYLVSLLAFLLCFLPANRAYSIDIWRKPQLKVEQIPQWAILILQIQLGIVYFYAGLAKLHSDWLFDALPLRIWLLRQADFPLIGSFLAMPVTAYLFAWFGVLYDLSIPFWLAWRRSRPWAYLSVIVFHSLTALLFYIGVFPFLMIAFTTIFFSKFWHQKIITNFGRIFILTLSKLKYQTRETVPKMNFGTWKKPIPALLYLFVAWQLLFPLRHWLYPGDVLWTGEGFRWSWMVMLVEKTGTAQFRVRDTATGRESEVQNSDYLSAKQEVMMSYQADMIVQFAQHLVQDFKKNKGYESPIVTVDCFVSLNGRPARRYIAKDSDLMQVKNSFLANKLIIRY